MPQIHPTAIVSADARLAADVTVGPFAVIEGPVKLGDGVTVAGRALIRGRTEIGEGTRIGVGAIIGADPQDLRFDPKTESGVIIGPRNDIREHATIHRGSKNNAYTRTGSDNLIMGGAHLAHDVSLGNHNTLENNVLLAGHVKVGDHAFLGGGAGFHQFIHVGDLAVIQSCSAVSQDVPPYCISHGQNIICGLNIAGLRRAGFSISVRADLKRAYRLIYLSGRSRTEVAAEAESHEWSDEARIFFKAFIAHSAKGVSSPVTAASRRNK